MSDAGLGTTAEPVTLSTAQVELPSLAGRLDGEGLRRLQRRLDELLDAGARLLVADLSGISGVDGRFVDLLARTDQLRRRRGAGCSGRAGFVDGQSARQARSPRTTRHGGHRIRPGSPAIGCG
jgi:hypothetical protein